MPTTPARVLFSELFSALVEPPPDSSEQVIPLSENGPDGLLRVLPSGEEIPGSQALDDFPDPQGLAAEDFQDHPGVRPVWEWPEHAVQRNNQRQVAAAFTRGLEDLVQEFVTDDGSHARTTNHRRRDQLGLQDFDRTGCSGYRQTSPVRRSR